MEAFLSNLDAIGQRKIRAAVRATDEVAEIILSESKELCPVSPTNEFLLDGNKRMKADKPRKSKKTGKIQKFKRNPLHTGHSGALRDSGSTTGATIKGGEIVAEIGYNTDYAAAVHERTAVLHGAKLQAKYPGARIPNLKGQAKFLSIPMLKWRKRYAAYVAEAVANA
jgi:hypothetical protein